MDTVHTTAHDQAYRQARQRSPLADEILQLLLVRCVTLEQAGCCICRHGLHSRIRLMLAWCEIQDWTCSRQRAARRTSRSAAALTDAANFPAATFASFAACAGVWCALTAACVKRVGLSLWARHFDCTAAWKHEPFKAYAMLLRCRWATDERRKALDLSLILNCCNFCLM